MRLKRYQKAEDFYNRAESFLLEREAEHNLILGLCTTLIEQPEYYLHQPYLALVEEDGAIIGASLMTPPYNLTLSNIKKPEALSLIANDVFTEFRTLPGVSGLPENCLAFAASWQGLSGQTYHRAMAQRIYQLDKVNPVAPVPGQFRRAIEPDRRLLLDWMIAFSVEAFEGSDPDVARLQRNVESMLTSKIRGAYIWDDGQPVSFSAYGGLTPHGCRIGPVYTPPEYRGLGYASACVATLSQHLLDRGRKFVFLYTDLANPTSNHIYQVIGYHPVCDADVYEFERDT